MINAQEIEAIVERTVRRVVREELAGLLCRMPEAASSPAPAPPLPPGDYQGPFLLSERELMQAESLLPEEEGKILRQRVYAARAEKQGNRQLAAKLRRKADLMEQALQGRRLTSRVG